MNTDTLPTLATLRSIDALKALLCGERAAVETYEQAIHAFHTDVPNELTRCLQSHQNRVEKLIVRIYELGGKPAESSGTWGAFARLVEGGAALLGRTATVSTLEEGEDHGVRLYEERITDLDPESWNLVEGDLQLEQRASHAMIRDLRKKIL